jgi:hypothetical protein
VGHHRVPLLQVRRDAKFQPRLTTDEALVRQYATALQAGVEFPPVKVARINGHGYLVDGWHRMAAHERAGRTDIDIELVDVRGENEALWVASKANLAHGQALNRKEVRLALGALVRARRHIKPNRAGFLTYKEIALELGGRVSVQTVNNWMWDDHPTVAAKMSDKLPAEAPRDAVRDDQEGYVREALAAVNTVSVASRGVRDAQRRQPILEAVEELLRDLQAIPIDEFDDPPANEPDRAAEGAPAGDF